MSIESENNIERSIGRLEGKLDSVIGLVGDLKANFDAMEKGRLSRLEVQFATVSAEMGMKAKSSAMVYSIIGSVLASVAAAVLLRLLIK